MGSKKTGVCNGVWRQVDARGFDKACDVRSLEILNLRHKAEPVLRSEWGTENLRLAHAVCELLTALQPSTANARTGDLGKRAVRAGVSKSI